MPSTFDTTTFIMELDIYQVDAFTENLFGGNPAAVIPLEKWLNDDLMQTIAMENNLSETVFFVKKGKDYDIRWFTPAFEINLCGHATLAASYVLFELLNHNENEIVFHSKSGPLKVEKSGNAGKFAATMDFPSWKPERTEEYPIDLSSMLGVKEIVGVYKYRELLVELNTEEDVKKAKPDFTSLKKLKDMVIITSPGKEVDFVSRFFAPTAGIDEDPVTGSAHSQLIPFWSEKLGKRKMMAKQLSQRGGDLTCEHLGDRVLMGGGCVLFKKGQIFI